MIKQQTLNNQKTCLKPSCYRSERNNNRVAFFVLSKRAKNSEYSSHPKFRIEDKFSGKIHAENTDAGAVFKISIPYADKATLKEIH